VLLGCLRSLLLCLSPEPVESPPPSLTDFPPPFPPPPAASPVQPLARDSLRLERVISIVTGGAFSALGAGAVSSRFPEDQCSHSPFFFFPNFFPAPFFSSSDCAATSPSPSKSFSFLSGSAPFFVHWQTIPSLLAHNVTRQLGPVGHSVFLSLGDAPCGSL